jgi:hypothetical protein
MGTDYYFHDASEAAGPTDEQTSWTADQNATGYDTARTMTTTIGTSEVRTADTTSSAGNQYHYHRVFVTPELAAQTISSQSLVCFIGAEAGSNNDFDWGWGVYVWRSGSNVATIFANKVSTGAMITGADRGHIDSESATETELQDGDRICCEIWFIGDGSDNGIRVNHLYDGTDEITIDGEANASCASKLRFVDDTITEYTAPAGISFHKFEFGL